MQDSRKRKGVDGFDLPFGDLNIVLMLGFQKFRWCLFFGRFSKSNLFSKFRLFFFLFFYDLL